MTQGHGGGGGGVEGTEERGPATLWGQLFLDIQVCENTCYGPLISSFHVWKCGHLLVLSRRAAL